MTGTDQPGYLQIYPRATILTPSQADPYRIQTSLGYLLGQNISAYAYPFPYPGYTYVPFTPGVPVRLYGSVIGSAGAYDYFSKGDFDAYFEVFFEVTSSQVANPWPIGTGNPGFIQGASVIIVPEPSAGLFVLAGLLLFGLRRLTRKLASPKSGA